MWEVVAETMRTTSSAPMATTLRRPDGRLCHWTVRSTYGAPGGRWANVIALTASLQGVHGFGKDVALGPGFEARVETLLDEAAERFAREPGSRRVTGHHFVGWLGTLRSEMETGVHTFRIAPDHERSDIRVVTHPPDAFSEFTDSLDPQLVSRIGFGNGKGAKPYDLGDDVVALCWTGLDRTLGADGTLPTAFAAVPRLEPVVADAWVRDPDAVRRAVAEDDVSGLVERWAVARGILPRRLVQAVVELADALPLMPVMVASMASGRPRSYREDDHMSWRCVPVDAVRRLVPLPPSWVPQGLDEWTAFAKLGPVLDRFEDLAHGEAAWSRLLNHGGRWAGFAERLDVLTGGRGPWHAGSDLDDVARSYAEQVLAPCVAGVTKGGTVPDGTDWDAWTGAARSLLFSGRSLVRQEEVSVSWHRRQHRMRAEIAEMAGPGKDPLAWRAGLPDATYGDVSIRVLTDERQLLAEGAYGSEDDAEGLDHCVGGYGPTCRGEGVRILSIRRIRSDGAYERLSTAQVGMTPDGPVVDEHRGRGNGDPCEMARDVLERYVEDVGTGRLAVDHEALEPMPDGDALSSCGYDPADADQRSAARGLWHGLVPGTVEVMDEPTLAAFAVSLLGGATWRTEPIGSPSGFVPEIAGIQTMSF